MVCNIIVLRWLAPEAMGLWQSLLLIATYSGILQVGIIHGLNRELPFSMGQGNSGSVLDLAATARAAALAGSTVCVSMTPLGWILFETSAERWGAAAVLLGASAQLYRSYLGATFRAARTFEVLARIQLLVAVLTVATLPLVLWKGYPGLAVRFVVLAMSYAVLCHAFRPLKQVGSFRAAALKHLLTTGVPLFGFGYLSDVARSFPRLALLSLGGVAWVGIFAPANAVIGALGMIPASLGTYIYPQMTYRYGRTGEASSIWPMAKSTALWSLVVGIPAAVMLALIVPFVIPILFPAYLESISAVQWTALAGVFVGASVAVNALASLKAYRWMYTFLTARLTLLFVFPWLGGKIWGHVAGVAAGMALAYAIDFVVVLVVVRRATAETNGATE